MGAPVHGLLPPDQFVPLAEQTGLIRPLTLYMLDAALHQCAAWRGAGYDVAVAVNVTGRDLLDLRFPEEVAEAIARAGTAPEALELEITESTIMTDAARARSVLVQLSELGVRLAIDDFGSGHSSLGYLKRLPIDVLKIDRSFVINMADGTDDAVIVRSTIDLGHNLGLEVVAEGVETEEALARLDRAGLRHGPGLLPGPPAADRGGRVDRAAAGDEAPAGLPRSQRLTTGARPRTGLAPRFADLRRG